MRQFANCVECSIIALHHPAPSATASTCALLLTLHHTLPHSPHSPCSPNPLAQCARQSRPAGVSGVLKLSRSRTLSIIAWQPAWSQAYLPTLRVTYTDAWMGHPHSAAPKLRPAQQCQQKRLNAPNRASTEATQQRNPPTSKHMRCPRRLYVRTCFVMSILCGVNTVTAGA